MRAARIVEGEMFGFPTWRWPGQRKQTTPAPERGVLVTFGDGCDGDTLETVLGRLRGYTIAISTSGTPMRDVRLVDVGPGWTLTVHSVDEAGQPVGASEVVPFEDLTAIHVY